MSGDVLRIVQFEGRFAPMAMVAYLSYLSSLRAPSEALALQVAATSDSLTTFTPQIPKALIGADALNQTPVLVIKFRSRENIRGGCILTRPCLCGEARAAARDLCPVHAFWQPLRANLHPGDAIFGTLSANSVNRHLKPIMTKLGYLQGRRFSSHGFRKGETHEISASGSTLATIIGSGTWTSGGYKSYLDLQADEAANISALLLENADSDSADSDKERPSRLQSIRNKLPKVPLAISKGRTHAPPKRPMETPDRESSVISETSAEATSEEECDILS